MKRLLNLILLFSIGILAFGCKPSINENNEPKSKFEIKMSHARGFKIFKFKGYSILEIIHPWPNSTQKFNYILKEKHQVVPDSLRHFPQIEVPLKRLVATSTTHLPALEMLGVTPTLKGFSDIANISSPTIRKLVEKGQIKEVGQNEQLSTEKLIELSPDAIVAFGINNQNPVLEKLQKNGIQIIYNGDWNEQTPLGKAEWIKFFGVLYGKEKQATTIFNQIEQNYLKIKHLTNTATHKPTVFCGGLLEKIWYVPQGKSWAALFLNDAKSNYLWKSSNGTGSLALSFEQVLHQAKHAEYWIAPGNFNSISEMKNQNIHYQQFDAFKTKKVYTYLKHDPKQKGMLYFEQAGARPDLVLKDLLFILHPELVSNHKLLYFKKLN